MIERWIRFLSAAMWKRKRGRALAVFTFHQVSPQFDPRFQHEATWTRLDHFEQQLDFIKDYFKVLPLPEAMAKWKRDDLRGMFAAITFDDGDVTVRDHIVPALSKRGLPATFFVNSAHGQGKGYYWFPVMNYLANAPDAAVKAKLTAELKEKADKLRRTEDAAFYEQTRREVEALASIVDDSKPLLVDRDYLATLDEKQFTVGLHGHEHQRFALMPPQWQMENLQKNIEALSDLKTYRPIFAIPFGRPMDWDMTLVHAALHLNVDMVSSNGGINFQRDVHLLRMPSDGRDVKAEFNREIVGW